MRLQAKTFSFILILLAAFALTFCSATTSNACLVQDPFSDDDPFGGKKKATKKKATKKKATKVDAETEKATDDKDDKEKSEDKEEPKATAPPEEKINQQYAQLHLRDGSIIGGDIQAEAITVKTAYGMLTVPISRIVRVYPGLQSNPELNTRIDTLVKDLGGKESAKRDGAQKELLRMGIKIRDILKRAQDGGNAERKKRLIQIQAELDELAEEAAEELEEVEPQMINEDTIVTPDFSIVGEIQQKEFKVVSKFGDLRVQLADIRLADRKIKETKSTIRKSVSVGAMAFFQTTPVKTSIRVNKGDKIEIKADGVVQWVNWSNSSTPEGLTNRSQWNGINSGKLTARIGSDNSKCVQIGSNASFVAKSSGVLYLGIAMRDSYASGTSGYTWTGAYKAKVVVKPSE